MIDRRIGGGATPSVSLIKRISWASVFAGVFIAFVLQFFLGTVVLAGLEMARAWDRTGTAAFWFLVANVISLFTGGWVASRLAGVPRRSDALLQGVLMWSVSVFIVFNLLMGTGGGAIGHGVSARPVAAAYAERAMELQSPRAFPPGWDQAAPADRGSIPPAALLVLLSLGGMAAIAGAWLGRPREMYFRYGFPTT